MKLMLWKKAKPLKLIRPHDNIQHSYADGKHSKATLPSVCKDCVKKGMGKYADWEFNSELIKGNDNEI